MNQPTSDTAIYTSQETSNSKTKAQYPFFANSLKYGITGGVLLSIYFFILKSAGMQDAIGMKYAGYFIFGAVLALAIGDYDRFLKTGTTFINGIKFALRISFITGLTLVAVDTVTFFINSDLVFSKYGMDADDLPSLLIVNAAVFLEVFVAGIIFTQISLQYFKSRRDYDG
ncbi:MAG: hypothetical protein AAGJ18_20300 [Bacteroidota bacterium]